jgi:3-oxoacyl-[acyl-carrier-protein] synthase II
VQRRVVVTGLGLVTPLAIGVEETWQRILAGESGIRTIQKFDASGYKCQIAGEVLDFNPEDWLPKKQVKRLDTFIHFGIAATRMAWEMAGLATPLDDKLGPRTGCIMGVGLGGLQTLEETIPKVAEKGPESRVSPFFIPKLIGNMLPGEVSMEFGAKGPNTCLATACAAGTHAVGEAMKVIQRGAADIMVCGGAEAVVTPTTLQGFGTAKALSTRNDDPARASRPFDADRDGFVMSEGSGVLILESLESAQERGANIIAEIVGYGLSSDGYHMTAPEPTGNGYIRCMQMALDDAGYKAEDLDYINAHGTSTGLNDLTETLAIKTLFGGHAKKLAVSSTKSMIGHMLGATGGVEAVMSVLTLRDQVMPPTINYTTPDPECDLDYVPNEKRAGQVRTVLSNSFGFGGTNASAIFAQYK